MPPDAQHTKRRWDKIRDNPDCDLALTQESVAQYLSRPESEFVSERIRETLTQFARYRVAQRAFLSLGEPAAPGDLATCEGLETFLVPAVEGALSMSAFLAHLGERLGDEARRTFVAAMVADIQDLLAKWGNNAFSGRPYADENAITDAVRPALREQFAPLSITEAAAMACRVVLHLLTLKLTRSSEEALFITEIGDKLGDEQMFTALSNAIDFLIKAFQKGPGETVSERIASATFDTEAGAKAPGGGWSWTVGANLPPMLFFTAAAVDAFAELDLYLIRASKKPEARDLARFLAANTEKVQQLELCVDMARLWVKTAVLPNLIVGYGQHVELLPDGPLPYDSNPKGYDQYAAELARVEDLRHPPMVFYNSLYALLILLWSWGDWDDDGERRDQDTGEKINRSLAQLVYNYDSIPAVKQVLTRFWYTFSLPGKGIFQPGAESKCRYLDSGFLPLLTRLLVLFVVYEVGDRNTLEPIIRGLYVELLQNRNRQQPQYSALWASRAVEVFSTQRAIQALTFYYAYARGKEYSERKAGGLPTDGGGQFVTFVNRTGVPLRLEAVAAGAGPAAGPTAPTDGAAHPEPAPVETVEARTWPDYCRQLPGFQFPKFPNEEERMLMDAATDLGAAVLKAVHEGEIRNIRTAKVLLNWIAELVQKPSIDKSVRTGLLASLSELFSELRGKDRPV
jgi:hypothetical protein